MSEHALPRVLLVFVDGIGYGRPGPQNPFDGAPISILAPLAGHDGPGDPRFVYGSLDATLGHPGLPQSATGQAAIFTGDDAVAVAGGHREGYPTRALAALLGERSVLRRAREAGKRAGLLNAYDPDYAARIARIARGEEPDARSKSNARRRVRPSATTLTALAGGGALRTFDDAHRGLAATFDVTGEICRAYGLDAPVRPVQAAANAVAAGAAELDLALFEMFLTDKAGHAQDQSWARMEVLRVERFLEALVAAVDPREQLVLVTSDHGNLEDLSTRTHTRARVPLLAYGAGAAKVAARCDSLTDLAPWLLSLGDAEIGGIAGKRREQD